MTQISFSKHFLSILAVAALLFFQAFNSLAMPPQVNTPLESRLYQGSVDEITTFIKQRQKQIDKIIAEIESRVDKKTAQEQYSSITAIENLFQGLSLQYKTLLKELSRTPSAALNKPIVAGPTYDIEDFDKIIAFQRQVNTQLADNNKKLALLKSRLENLKEGAVAQLSEYTELAKNDPTDTLSLYEKYGQLLILQGECALLRIKKPKLEKLLTELNDNEKTAADWVKEAFTKLKVTPEDINKARKLTDQSQTFLQKTTDDTRAEYQDLNRRLLIYEARFDSALNKLEASKKNDLAREGWQIEKERIELIIEALKLRLQLLNQNQLNGELKLLKNNFRLQWLSNHEARTKKTSFTDFIAEWSREIDKLVRKQEANTTLISETTLARSNLTQKLVTINNQRAAAQSAQLREALDTLTRQATKVNENIDKLILALSENNHDIRNAKREIEQILELTRYSISRGERIRTWSALHLIGLKDRVLSILSYPLFSIGTSTITLLIILKIIILLFSGIIFLRLLRRKIASLLEKKVGMSMGAINSITTLGYYASLLVGTLIILSTAGLDLSQLSIILGALGVGIGFGLQTITNNFISGIILLTEQTVKVGDYVNLADGVVGEVKKMAIRATVVRTVEGEDIIVPNSDLISNRVNTRTYGDDW